MSTNSKPLAACEAAHTEQDAFILGLSEPHAIHGMTYDDDPCSPRSVAYDMGRNVGEALADLTDAQLSPELRAFIFRAVNSHADLVSALQGAMEVYFDGDYEDMETVKAARAALAKAKQS